MTATRKQTEDPPQQHTAERPFCADPDCICHDDSKLIEKYITQPLNEGLMSNAEALRVLWDRQVYV